MSVVNCLFKNYFCSYKIIRSVSSLIDICSIYVISFSKSYLYDIVFDNWILNIRMLIIDFDIVLEIRFYIDISLFW